MLCVYFCQMHGRKYPALCLPVHDPAGWQPFVHQRPAKSAGWHWCGANYGHSNPAASCKAGQLFADAHHALLDQKFNSFEDQIIAVADYIIGRLNDDHGLLTFISKNLSWGIFKTAFENTLPDESLQFYDYIFEQMKKNRSEEHTSELQSH